MYNACLFLKHVFYRVLHFDHLLNTGNQMKYYQPYATAGCHRGILLLTVHVFCNFLSNRFIHDDTLRFVRIFGADNGFNLIAVVGICFGGGSVACPSFNLVFLFIRTTVSVLSHKCFLCGLSVNTAADSVFIFRRRLRVSLVVGLVLRDELCSLDNRPVSGSKNNNSPFGQLFELQFELS